MKLEVSVDLHDEGGEQHGVLAALKFADPLVSLFSAARRLRSSTVEDRLREPSLALSRKKTPSAKLISSGGGTRDRCFRPLRVTGAEGVLFNDDDAMEVLALLPELVCGFFLLIGVLMSVGILIL